MEFLSKYPTILVAIGAILAALIGGIFLIISKILEKNNKERELNKQLENQKELEEYKEQKNKKNAKNEERIKILKDSFHTMKKIISYLELYAAPTTAEPIEERKKYALEAAKLFNKARQDAGINEIHIKGTNITTFLGRLMGSVQTMENYANQGSKPHQITHAQELLLEKIKPLNNEINEEMKKLSLD